MTASTAGEIAFTFEVPAAHDDGDVAVTLRCDLGETKVLSDVIATVEDGEVIAMAGLASIEMLALGAAALVLGAWILAVSRPNRTSRSAAAGRGRPTEA